MIRLEEYRLVGYKNIEEANLTFSDFNIVIGPNNSGKSNFLQSISFLNYVITASMDDVEKNFSRGFYSTYLKEVRPDLFFNSSEVNTDKKGLTEFYLVFSNTESNCIFHYSLIIEWAATLFSPETRYRIKFEKLDFKVRNKTGKSTIIFERQNEKVIYGRQFSKVSIAEKVPNYFSVIRFLKIFGEEINEYNDAVESLSEILRTPIFYFSHIELLKTDQDRLNAFNGREVSFGLEKEILTLESHKHWPIFKQALKNILDINDVVAYSYKGEKESPEVPLTKLLFFMHMGRYKKITDFSDGSVLIMALITKILASKSSLFLIEEPENSIHPRALLDFISFMKSFTHNSQYIITSHSIAILNTASIEGVIVSSLDEKGFSQLSNVTSQKQLFSRFKRSSISFSDELFFRMNNEKEFE